MNGDPKSIFGEALLPTMMMLEPGQRLDDVEFASRLLMILYPHLVVRRGFPSRCTMAPATRKALESAQYPTNEISLLCAEPTTARDAVEVIDTALRLSGVEPVVVGDKLMMARSIPQR